MEFCPVCTLRRALAGGVESGESTFEESVRPTPDQPAQRFEHYELSMGEDGKPVELGRGAMGFTYKGRISFLCVGRSHPVVREATSPNKSTSLAWNIKQTRNVPYI